MKNEATQENEVMYEEGIVLTDAQKKSQRARNIAIGLVLGGLVVLFYGATVVKFGPEILQRAM